MRFSHVALGTVALLWTAPHAQAADSCKQVKSKGTFTEIAVPGAAETYVAGINNQGAIVGGYRTANGSGAFVLDQGVYSTVTIPGSTNTVITDINSSGVMVGSYFAEGTGYHGFIRDGGTVTTIDPPGAIAASVNGINDAGTVVGHYLVPGGEDGVEHGFVYQDGQFLTVDYPGSPSGTLLDINNAGTALGGYATPTPPAYFLYTAAGAFSTVPVCAPQTTLMTISNQGDLIGSMPTGINTTVGIVASSRGLLVVQPPGASLSVLAAGNAGDTLVGEYADGAGNRHGLMFVPK
jgi:hypothetical protein